MNNQVGARRRILHIGGMEGVNRRLPSGIGRGGALALASVTAAFLVSGCGSDKSDTLSAAPSSQPVVAERTAGPAAPAPVESQMKTAPQGEVAAVTSADSMPPEVTASARDSSVVPGMVVEITAQGTPDVSKIVLSDGIGRRQAFAYDSTSKVWRTFYRVPIRTRTERVGLSVTASNSSKRWRRVWVFMNVEPAGEATKQ